MTDSDFYNDVSVDHSDSNIYTLDIDVRCALIFARISLEAVIAISPGSLSSVRERLAQEIETLNIESPEKANTLARTIGQFGEDLGPIAKHDSRTDNTWYFD